MVQGVKRRVRALNALLLTLSDTDENRVLPHQLEIDLDNISHDMIQGGCLDGGRCLCL